MLNKVVNSPGTGISILFSYAYFKIYLKEYITRLIRGEKNKEMIKIDELLSK